MSDHIGTVSVYDIGREVRIEHEGWVHTGTLEMVQHEAAWIKGRPPRCMVRIRYSSGARWLKTIDSDHVIEYLADDGEVS